MLFLRPRFDYWPVVMYLFRVEGRNADPSGRAV
jgi:hypothetical protein